MQRLFQWLQKNECSAGFHWTVRESCRLLNQLVVMCCYWLFVLVSSVLLLALATATAVAPRGHSYWMQAPLLHQLRRQISLRTSQLAGIVRFGTLSNIIIHLFNSSIITKSSVFFSNFSVNSSLSSSVDNDFSLGCSSFSGSSTL